MSFNRVLYKYYINWTSVFCQPVCYLSQDVNPTYQREFCCLLPWVELTKVMWANLLLAASVQCSRPVVAVRWSSVVASFCSEDRAYVNPLVCAFFVALLPLWIIIAKRNPATREVLYFGWEPVIIAMAISRYEGYKSLCPRKDGCIQTSLQNLSRVLYLQLSNTFAS